MKIIEDLLYTKNHEWARVEGDFAFIGITDFAQHSLGDIVFVELPELDTEFEKGDSFGTVESVKAAEDIYIPLSGTVVEINEEISDDPALVNKDPYENWFVKIELSEKSEAEDLMDAKAYEEHCSKEE
jgi:glycine cleavage system H protein